MREETTKARNEALVRAAKYICNLRDGLCPMVVENYRCLSACGPDTQPWRCWIDHFLTSAGIKEDKGTEEGNEPNANHPALGIDPLNNS